MSSMIKNSVFAALAAATFAAGAALPVAADAASLFKEPGKWFNETICCKSPGGDRPGYQPPPPRQPTYSAALEVECWKPGEDSRWGTSRITGWSSVSVEEARSRAYAKYQASNVCQDTWHDQNLTDGTARWL
jgi:hypothetical protein